MSIFVMSAQIIHYHLLSSLADAILGSPLLTAGRCTGTVNFFSETFSVKKP